MTKKINDEIMQGQQEVSAAAAGTLVPFPSSPWKDIPPEELQKRADKLKENMKERERQNPNWWHDLLARNAHGIVRSTNENLRLFVRNIISPKMDVFAQKLYTHYGKLMRDRDGATFAADLSRDYGVEFNTSRAMDAIGHFAEEYHPLKERLEHMQWDGIPRLETMFIDWLCAEDDEEGYTRLVAKQFGKAMIKRIYEPGCEHQEILVLVGSQGCYKSGILNDLSCGFFTDSLRSTDSKIVGEETAGSWIVELAEFRLFENMKEEQKKEFISRRKEKYRPSYSRLGDEFPRQFVLAATTNKMEFLSDYTGDRRYLPIRCGSKKEITAVAPWDNFKAEVEQILAEAVALYKEDPSIRIPPHAWDLCDRRREEFRFENPYFEEVTKFIEDAGKPKLISVEWLCNKFGWSGMVDRKTKAQLGDCIRRFGGYEQLMKQKKVFGKNTRNGWEREEE